MLPCSPVRKLAALVLVIGCYKSEVGIPPPVQRPSILLVTLDTTRADAIGPEQHNVDTPSFNALAARGRRFRYAYCAVPQTLASHASMLTGLYPAGHGLHENGRYLSDKVPLVAEQLKKAGYRTAAFVSAFAVDRRFGLARGFDVYDDQFGAAAERGAGETTDRALKEIAAGGGGAPLFLWVHYYDPHFPYVPPEPFKSKFARQPYFGEIAYVDEQLGRLAAAFDKLGGPKAIILVGDHGEGLGDHGELQHGDLLYQSTVHVPLVLIGPGVAGGTSDAPVSTRRIYHTILDWAGIDAKNSLRGEAHEAVIGEAMKPFLDYGWKPQVMAVDGKFKTILAGKTEVYDVVADPGETHDLAASADVSRDARAALRDYPIPSPDAATAPPNATDEERRKLAALGYINSGVKPVIRPDAPRPADMAALFPLLDDAARLFVHAQYAQAIPVLEKILAKDPHNLDAALRLATSYSSLGQNAKALAAFQRAEAIAPNSQDVRTYLGLHDARVGDWQKALPLLQSVVDEAPDRLPAVEGLAMTQMALGQTDAAITSFEKARAMQGSAFQHDVELGVLYLAARRFEDARDALDRVPPSSPAYSMALFKRAQVSVLLHEPDAPARIATAKQHANPTTRVLIEREKLFR